ncbi:MAG: hypothetical protein LBS01_03850 [Prevotellaceae bacterium]|jgi:hypothetical protein|nr:hypothetical protein [Prevotellaceae bacterium]
MKKHVFIIGFWAACVALPNMLHAQWGFTVTQGQRGNCVGCDNIKITVIDIGRIPLFGFPTRQECEAVRQQFAGISQSFTCGCTLYLICSACTGSDLIMPGMSNGTGISGSANLTGTNEGNSFYTSNPYDATQDAYEQKRLQNEALLGNDEPNHTITRDISFDNAVAALTYINGRGGANANAKPFDKRLGRAGAKGGFNINPNLSSNANRYNGQMFQRAPSDLGTTVWTTGTRMGVETDNVLGKVKREVDFSGLNIEQKVQMQTSISTIEKGRKKVEAEIVALNEEAKEAKTEEEKYAKKMDAAATEEEEFAAADAADAAAARAAKKEKAAKELQTQLNDYDKMMKNPTPTDQDGKPCSVQECKNEYAQKQLKKVTDFANIVKGIRERKSKEQTSQKQQEEKK